MVKRRSSAGSRSCILRRPSGVVEASRRTSPRSSSGFKKSATPLPAAPCPMSESMPEMYSRRSSTLLGAVLASTWRRRSSISPRRRAPATSAPVSSSRICMLRQVAGHLAGGDARGERRDDGRLADAGVADQQRVVLGAALEDLQQPADLDVAADDRVEAPLAGALGEIAGVLLGAAGAAAGELGGETGGDHVTRHAGERGHVRTERARPEPEGLEDHRRRAADLLRQRVEQVLDPRRAPARPTPSPPGRGARAWRSRGTRDRSSSWASGPAASPPRRRSPKARRRPS